VSAVASQPKTEIFCSYSRKDEKLFNELKNHLSSLKLSGASIELHERRILGNTWDDNVDEHINTANVILLLISANFIASDYVFSTEVKRALERHKAGEARVIPIILRPVHWRSAPFGTLRALPVDAKPVTTWDNQDEAFFDIARGIRAVIEASALPPIWNVPHNRNPNFTGREVVLSDLHSTLTSGRPAVLIGLGGVGKTQLAVEYAYRHAADFSVVWWVRAEEPATLAADYTNLAIQLGLPQKDATDQRILVDAVRRWFGENAGWLLIFDSASDQSAISSYLPQGTYGRVLITSRSPDWQSPARSTQLTVLTQAEAVEFLLRRTRQTDKKNAASLAEALGNLPLALEQAGAYIEETRQSISDYLKLFLAQEQKLLSLGTPSTGYPATVATTWEILFQQVQKLSPAAIDLMNLCAFLAPDDIPLKLLSDGGAELPESLATVASDAVSLEEAVNALRRYSLVDVREDAFSVHRLVQAVIRERLDEENRKIWAGAAVLLLNAAFEFKKEDLQTWSECSRLLPHVIATTSHAETLKVSLPETAWLLNELGRYLSNARAQFNDAKRMYERALVIDELIYGQDHPETAASLNNLGMILNELGKLQEAKDYFERALALNVASYGPNHPKTAISLNNTGSILSELGDFVEARERLERALVIDEKSLGPNHPTIATRLNNIGDILQSSGDLAGAHEYYERALSIDEAAYGPNHPEVAISLNNIGSVLSELGDLNEAREYYERALSIKEAAYGPNHPDVAISLNNIGSVLNKLGELEEARKYFERALAIRTAVYGPNHPAVAASISSLTRVTKALEEQTEKLTLQGRALETIQKFLELAGATVRREEGRGFTVESVVGKLQPYAPFPVCLAADNEGDLDITGLHKHSGKLLQKRKEKGRVGILIYREPPNAVARIRMSEMRLRDSFALIPIPLAAIEQALPTREIYTGLLAEYAERYLPGADIFDDRNAIGDTITFFGRNELLHRLKEELLGYQGTGLFGLRKSGKTSVLLQLAFTLRDHPVVHVDLQTHGGKPRFGAELFNEILLRLAALIGERDPQLRTTTRRYENDRPAAALTTDFVRRIGELSQSLERAGYKLPILCFLDEIERILPAASDPRERAEEFNAFFGALRALSQEQRKLTLLVADVHPDLNRINYWEQEGVATNPVNGFFKEIFLRPFAMEETKLMIADIGQLMGRSFDNQMLEAIHHESGGHPFVARQLARLVSSKIAAKHNEPITVELARQYLAKPFSYSAVLKSYFEQNVWGDLKKRDFKAAMFVLKVLAANDKVEWVPESTFRDRAEVDFTESKLLDALLWLEAVGLVARKEKDSGDSYQIKLPLLSSWLLLDMEQEERRRWQINS
jgi:Tfp pilus assembly protein PilF